MNTLPFTVLDTLPEAPKKQAALDFAREFQDFHKKIVVLDDDPTGIQTVHDVYVYTDWNRETLKKAFLDSNQTFFLLTNSRSLSSADTTALHEEIARNLCAVSRELGKEFILLSRGDSTLRGHYPLETDILRSVLETELSVSFQGEIFCPFFLEGGRYTLNDIHYVREGSCLTPAGETEFAKDKTFGFHASNLMEYFEEKTGGTFPKNRCISISIEELRSRNYDAIVEKLCSSDQFSRIIVNAADYTDVQVFCTAWLRAMKRGCLYLARCAAALPKVLGNISDQPCLTRQDLRQETSRNGGLILIGSHVKKTTDQLNALLHAGLSTEPLEFCVNEVFSEGGLARETSRVRLLAEQAILAGKTAVVYTSRKLLTPEGFSSEELLSLSVQISSALTAILSDLTIHPSFILAKGGITSSDAGTKGLGVKKALVLGQVKPGIPVWLTGEESKFPGTPYIIFPGNVGSKTTLKEIAEELI